MEAAVVWDVAILGGGAVGCAVLHRLSEAGYSCLLLEQKAHLLGGASSGNSGILHTGFDAKLANSEESHALQNSQEILKKRNLLEKWNIPHRVCGGIMLAYSKEELDTIKSLVKYAHSIGQADVRELSLQDIYRLEPHLSPTSSGVTGGMLIPRETTVDPGALPTALAHHALRTNRAKICVNSKVDKLCRADDTWKLTTCTGEMYKCRLCINAAGLGADRIHKTALNHMPFESYPIRGDFLVYEKAAGYLVNHILLAVPTAAKGKGIVVFKSVYNNLVVGPTWENVPRDTPTDSSPKLQVRKQLQAFGERLLPALTKFKVIGSYSGYRPATQFKDYQVVFDSKKMFLTLGGIRSTGLSGSLGIAERVRQLLEQVFPGRVLTKEPAVTETIATVSVTGRASYVLDGAEYQAQHPLVQFGLMSAKL